MNPGGPPGGPPVGPPGPHDLYYQHTMGGSQQQQQPSNPVSSYNGHSLQPQQPPLLQPNHQSYPPPPPQSYASSGGYYTTTNGGLTSPQQPGPHQLQGMGPGPNVLPPPNGGQPGMNPGFAGFDTSGQIAPPGMKPRVTATLWEDEGSLCFQVEARGICVARREDNHFINGTKLLNVAGMTRGRRDGILKSEKLRHVVKIGPMHLKGVWIPFERALDFANKEKITELLYPLFVHNINALLYHPTNQNRTSQVLAAQERRKAEQQHQHQMRNGQTASLPSVHHHSMSLGSQPHHGMPRPVMDRAHTFPTPPTSASSVMNGMGSSDNYPQWPPQSMNNGHSHNPMSIDTQLSNAARSMPATPASTPPGTSLASMHSYPPVTQGYDNSRSVYNAAPSSQQAPSTQQSPYQSHNAQDNRGMYPQTGYVKHEMGPPSSRPVGGPVQVDSKSSTGDGYVSQGQGQVQGEQASHGQVEEEADHEHDGEYTHDSNGYDATRSSAYYNSAPPVSSLQPAEHHQHAEMTGSPHQSASGRATPRTAPAYYPSQQDYNTSAQPQPPLRPLDYSATNDNRNQTNGTSGNDPYGPHSDINGSMQNGYSSQQPALNGTAVGSKRGRDEEDDRSGATELKRRKTLVDGQAPESTYDRPVATPVSRRR